MKIGIMSFAHMHAHSYAQCIQKLDDAVLSAIYDDNGKRGLKAAELYHCKYFSDLDEFLQTDIDAVIICSENSRHREMTEKAAMAKKHILCEKPIATNLKDAWEMIHICENQGVILQIAFPVRFSEPIFRLKKMIDYGDLGEILAIRTTNRGQNPGGWFIDEKYSGGGAVIDHTVHMADIMRWYLGKEVSEVYAHVDTYFHDGDIDDAGLLTLTFENGVIATHDASWSRCRNFPMWGDVTIEVMGTKGVLAVDAFKEHFCLYSNSDQSLEYKFYGKDMDEGLINDFISCVKEGKEPSITGFDGLKALEIALAAYESAKKKQSIFLTT
jgi:predicted dehydrogenase